LNGNRGFTLIETLMAAAILACGLVAVASIFSFAIRANMNNKQMSVATALLYDKMEEFKSASFSDPIWASAGSDDITQGGSRYIRVWQIGAGVPRSVTVIVYAQSNPLMHRQTELIRATTLVSPTF
jgi:prepilin-type N-terminal cleavage/methylation domain-containing protein